MEIVYVGIRAYVEFYLENPFDEDTHMQLNDGLTDTFDAMHSYFMDRDI